MLVTGRGFRFSVGPPPNPVFSFVSWQDWTWQREAVLDLGDSKKKPGFFLVLVLGRASIVQMVVFICGFAVSGSVCHWQGIGSWQGHHQPNVFLCFLVRKPRKHTFFASFGS